MLYHFENFPVRGDWIYCPLEHITILALDKMKYTFSEIKVTEQMNTQNVIWRFFTNLIGRITDEQDKLLVDCLNYKLQRCFSIVFEKEKTLNQ